MDNEESLDLKVLWDVLRKHLIAIIITAVLTGTAAFLISEFLIPRKYESSALLYVEGNTSASDTLNLNDINAAQKTAATCQIIFQSNSMLDSVILELNLPYTRSELRSMVSVTSLNSTEVMEISVTTGDPQTSSEIANEFAKLSMEEFRRVVKSGSIEIVEYAKVPKTHSFPNVMLFTAAGLLGGAAIVYIIFLLKEMLSVTVRSGDDLSKMFDVPVFAEIMDFEKPSDSKYNYSGYGGYDNTSGKKSSSGSRKRHHSSKGKRYVLDAETPFVIAEGYKAARTNIIFSLAACENKIISFTSANPGEGKSTTCDNMAISFADMGKRVLLIDCDMRKPTVHTTFGLNTQKGLSTILGGFSTVEESIYRGVRPSLDVITAGPIPPNPTELLSTRSMTILLENAIKEYDIVMLDTPPVNLVTDSQLLNNVIGGHVMVVKENSTTYPAISEAFEKINLASGKKLGIIKVCCTGEEKSGKKYGKYGHYGSYSYEYRRSEENKEV